MSTLTKARMYFHCTTCGSTDENATCTSPSTIHTGGRKTRPTSSVEEVTAENVAKFEAILDAEQAVRITRTALAFGQADPKSVKSDRDRLSNAIDALTPAEGASFAEWRKRATS